MEDFEEKRYPWTNAADFFLSGFWIELPAIHLLCGWLFIFFIILRINNTEKSPPYFRWSTLYFALTVYTNPAYNFIGLNINEIFGICSILYTIAYRKSLELKKSSPAVSFLILLFFISIFHNIAISFVYPDLIPDFSVAIIKLAINLKIIVLALNMSIIRTCISRGIGLGHLIRACVAAGAFAQLMYMLQAALNASGITPYGTYWDAGFVGIPSFGSVSIERGHMGKFIAPYFPFFLFALLAWKWRYRFILFSFVSICNFSASGLVFFSCYTFNAIFLFRKMIGPKSLALMLLTLSFLSFFIFNNIEVFSGIANKIYRFSIEGDESQGAGRSVELFLDYLRSYPFGIGYSGSTLRTAPNMPEINAAQFAVFTQFSALAVPIVLAYIVVLIKSIKEGARRSILSRCMVVGASITPIIYSADILWFVPLYWLPLEIIFAKTMDRAYSCRS